MTSLIFLQFLTPLLHRYLFSNTVLAQPSPQNRQPLTSFKNLPSIHVYKNQLMEKISLERNSGYIRALIVVKISDQKLHFFPVSEQYK
jgi:hypothetical protein